MLFEDTYKTIKSISTGTFRDKGSKFIGFAIPIQNEDDVKQQLAELKKKYYDATHLCYAYMLGHDKSAYRINDDGEPSGTAGKPIFNQILSKDLTNILIVVVRYYGGTKLGVSGLINAYKTASIEALQTAEIIEKTVNEVYEIGFDYSKMNEVMRILKDDNVKQTNQSFDNDCCITFNVRKMIANKITNQLQKIENLKLTFIGIG